MKVVITGGGGFIGRKLAHKILERGELTGPSGQREAVTEVVLFDAVAPPDGEFTDERVRAVVGDITDAGLVASVIDGDTNSVFHLAAVVSAGAEADFDLGYHVSTHETTSLCPVKRILVADQQTCLPSGIQWGVWLRRPESCPRVFLQ